MAPRFLQLGPVRLEYEQLGPRGDGPTLVFLHEGLGSLSGWRDVPERLTRATGLPALVYSRAGYGRSSPRAAWPTTFMHEEAALLPRVLAAAGIGRPILVGHSDGASIALIFAAEQAAVAAAAPQGLVLLAPHVFVEEETLASIAALVARPATHKALARQHGQRSQALLEGWAGVWRSPAFRSWDLRPLLPRVRCPLLVIQGEEDAFGTPAQVRALEDRCPGPVEVVLLPECGHAPHRDAAQATLEAIARFVTRLGAPAPAPAPMPTTAPATAPAPTTAPATVPAMGPAAAPAPEPAPLAPTPLPHLDLPEIPAEGAAVELAVDGRAVRLTNLGKPFWPELGLTKAHLLRYYAAVAAALLPHLRERPMVMKRYPDGWRGKFFFMKRTPGHAPEWVRTCTVDHGNGNVIDFPVVDDLPTLLWLVNLGCIDLNPWPVRESDLVRPDYVHLDLDPAPGASWERLCAAARRVHAALLALGAPACLKTSGSRGLHVYVPIARGPTQKEVWRWAQRFARDLARAEPALFTAEYTKSRRPEGTVLLDFNQNAWTRTLASVYSVRPVEGALVSTPLRWDELEAGVTLEQFDLRSVPARVAEVGDLWAPLAPEAAGRFDLAPHVPEPGRRAGGQRARRPAQALNPAPAVPALPAPHEEPPPGARPTPAEEPASREEPAPAEAPADHEYSGHEGAGEDDVPPLPAIEPGLWPALSLPLRPPLPPAECKTSHKLPVRGGWQYEPKWDGFRCVAFREGSTVALQSRGLRPLGRYFPEVVAALLALPEPRFVLDGELVVARDGDVSFEELQMRLHPAASRVERLSREIPASFLAFDLLLVGEEDLHRRPLEERRAALEPFAARCFAAAQGTVRLTPATRDRALAQEWFETLHGVDGVIAKRLDAAYAAGERTAMQKVKRQRAADCVVAGFRWHETEEDAIGSLLLGLYDPQDGLLHHAGHCSGLTATQRRELAVQLQPLRAPPGFTGRAPGGPSRWNQQEKPWEPLRPVLVVEVGYDHWSGGRFRHGTRLLRFRPDKPPEQCTFAQIPPPGQGALALLDAPPA